MNSRIVQLLLLLILLMVSFVISSESESSESLLSSSSSDAVDFYPIEEEGKCEVYIGDTDESNCSKYLPYTRIYTSNTYNQLESIQKANQLFQYILKYGDNNCSQPYVFQTICSALFPECQTYTNGKDIVIALPIRTCYNECKQSVKWCIGNEDDNKYFNCSSKINGGINSITNQEVQVLFYPKNEIFYNFEQFKSGILEIECRNTFINISNIIPTLEPSSPTLMPSETSSEELNYDNHHRSILFKIFICTIVIVPIILIIALIWYNFKKRSNKIKEQQQLNINQETTPLI